MFFKKKEDASVQNTASDVLTSPQYRENGTNKMMQGFQYPNIKGAYQRNTGYERVMAPSPTREELTPISYIEPTFIEEDLIENVEALLPPPKPDFDLAEATEAQINTEESSFSVFEEESHQSEVSELDRFATFDAVASVPPTQAPEASLNPVQAIVELDAIETVEDFNPFDESPPPLASINPSLEAESETAQTDGFVFISQPLPELEAEHPNEMNVSPSSSEGYLAFEDEDDFYNPLAIGETLPSFQVELIEEVSSEETQAPEKVEVLPVFLSTEALKDAVLERQADWAEALEGEPFEMGSFLIEGKASEASPSLQETLLTSHLLDSPEEEKVASLQMPQSPVEKPVVTPAFNVEEEDPFNIELFLPESSNHQNLNVPALVVESPDYSVEEAVVSPPISFELDDFMMPEESVLEPISDALMVTPKAVEPAFSFELDEQDMPVTPSFHHLDLDNTFLLEEDVPEDESEPLNVQDVMQNIDMAFLTPLIEDALTEVKDPSLHLGPTFVIEDKTLEDESEPLNVQDLMQNVDMAFLTPLIEDALTDVKEPQIQNTVVDDLDALSLVELVPTEEGLVDPSLFFSLDALENEATPDALRHDLETWHPPQDNTASPPPQSSPMEKTLIHSPDETSAKFELDQILKTDVPEHISLSEFANLALEDLNIVSKVDIPLGEGRLYFIHINEMYALIALKNHKYTLLQSFNSLPEGVNTQNVELELTWNAMGLEEQVFLLQIGNWGALLVENAHHICLVREL